MGSSTKWVRLAVAALLAVHLGLVAYSATRHSPTMLEPALLTAGLSHWEFHRFELYRVNPPLVRMVAALPVLAAGYEADWTGFYEAPGARPEFSMGADFIAANGERSLWLFSLARWACLPFTLLGGLFAFAYSRELWGGIDRDLDAGVGPLTPALSPAMKSGEVSASLAGERGKRPAAGSADSRAARWSPGDAAGLLTLAVWCFEPNILAHAELITNDVACTAFGLGATWLFWRWLKQPTWGRAGAAGLVLGLAELSKSSWLLLFGLWPVLAGVWWVARAWGGGRGSGADRGVQGGNAAEETRGQWDKGTGGRGDGRIDVAARDSANSAADSLPSVPFSPPPLVPSSPCPLVKKGNTRLTRCLHHPAAQLAGLLALALYLLNLGYVFDGTGTRLGEYDFISTSLTGLPKSGDVGNRFRGTWLGALPVPLPRQYVLGLDIQKHDFESWNRPSYLRGEWRHGGWWWYYLYGLWVKVPHGVQLLLAMALAFPLWRRWMERRATNVESPERESRGRVDALDTRHATLDLVVLLTPGLALFVLVSSQTAMNEHFRYVLPTLGTAIVLLGRASAYGTGER